MLVCIDPGHGGTDPGAVAEGVREADVVLDYARALEAALKPIGTTVIMTREDDVAVDLGMRCRIANDVSADAFISLHCNASPNARAEGVRVFHAAVSTRGKALARAIFDRIAAAEPQTGTGRHLPDDRCTRAIRGGPGSQRPPADLPWAGGTDGCERFGDRYRTLYVLRGTRMPANPDRARLPPVTVDRERLTDPWRGLVARAIADGVVDWLGRGVWQPA